ncbi:MAG: TetR/AcrR family transcriptional regulator [Thermodesulfobacteriota bacterium]
MRSCFGGVVRCACCHVALLKEKEKGGVRPILLIFLSPLNLACSVWSMPVAYSQTIVIFDSSRNKPDPLGELKSFVSHDSVELALLKVGPRPTGQIRRVRCRMRKSSSTLKNLREHEREVRKNLIMDAAISLFGHKSFKEVGMRDIARQAGISPASIYRYFADRDDLFVEAFARQCQEMEGRLQSILRKASDRTAEETARDFVQYLLEHGSFFEMMTHFMIHGTIKESAVARFNEMERRLLDVFDQIFVQAGVKGNVRLVSHAFFAALNGILITFRNYPGRTTEETRRHVHRLASLVATIFEKGAV